jgi:uncharacterized protein YbjT (DUF2867 family)
MKVIIFGATGMVGAAALIECLEDPEIEKVLTVGRRPTGRENPKLEELIHEDFLDFSSVRERFAEYDACLWCLGVSSAGMSEAEYRRITQHFTEAACKAMYVANPDMSVCFISGGGSDANARGMWQRVKGDAENSVLGMGFARAHALRPAGIVPRKGVVSRVPSYRFFYNYFGWLLTLIRKVAPGMVTDSDQLGRALIRVAKEGHAKPVLEGADINAVCD